MFNKILQKLVERALYKNKLITFEHILKFHLCLLTFAIGKYF